MASVEGRDQLLLRIRTCAIAIPSRTLDRAKAEEPGGDSTLVTLAMTVTDGAAAP